MAVYDRALPISEIFSHYFNGRALDKGFKYGYIGDGIGDACDD